MRAYPAVIPEASFLVYHSSRWYLGVLRFLVYHRSRWYPGGAGFLVYHRSR